MARVFITGSSDGLGLMAAKLLIEQGHEVILHGRNDGRSRDALAAAAGTRGVVTGDLSTIAGAKTVADQVNKLGRFDAVIHNAGIGYREGRVEIEPGVPERLRSQCARTLHSDCTDRKAEVDWSMSAPARTAACDHAWTTCFGPGELGAAIRLTRRANFAMCCWPLPLLAAGEKSSPMRWSLDGWRQRWAALQRRTIFTRGA